jgi:hypothetical protein
MVNKVVVLSPPVGCSEWIGNSVPLSLAAPKAASTALEAPVCLHFNREQGILGSLQILTFYTQDINIVGTEGTGYVLEHQPKVVPS